MRLWPVVFATWSLALGACGLLLDAAPKADGRDGLDAGAHDARADSATAPRDGAVQTDAMMATDAMGAAGTCAMPIPLESVAVSSTDGIRQTLTLEPGHSTRSAPDVLTPSCGCEGDRTGPERVYQYTPPGPGRIEIDTYGSDAAMTTFDTVLSAQSSCRDGVIACNDNADDSGGVGRSQIHLDASSSEPIYIIVDSCGAGGSLGLAVRWEPAMAEGSCDRPIPVSLRAGDLTTTVVYQVDHAVDHGESGPCEHCVRQGWGRGSDLVYAFTAEMEGTYSFLLTSPDFDPMIHVRSSCDPRDELVCNDDDVPMMDPARVSLTLGMGERILLFADQCAAWLRGQGALTVTFEGP